MNYFWRKNFGWSKSRQEIWDSCKKAYYFRYIARWEQGLKEKLKYFTSLNTLAQLKGSLVHDAIRQQILQHRAGRDVSLDSAVNYLKMRFKPIWQNPQNYLVEAVNGIGFEKEQLKQIISDSLKLIDNFFNILWHNYRGLKYLSHEVLEKFYIKGIPIWVQPDMVTLNNAEEIIITDWKTGKTEHEAEDDLQLGVYILWASEKYHYKSENIKAELVYLDSCNSSLFGRNALKLKELEEYIVKNAQEMLAIQHEDDLPASPTSLRCRFCNYAVICPDSILKT